MEEKVLEAANAARRNAKPGILSAYVSLNGTNPVLAVSLVVMVGVAAYTAKKFVDKATNKEGGQV